MAIKIKGKTNLENLNSGIENLSTNTKLKQPQYKTLDASLKLNNINIEEDSPSEANDQEIVTVANEDSGLEIFSNQLTTVQEQAAALKDEFVSGLMPAIQAIGESIQGQLIPVFTEITELFSGLSEKNQDLSVDIGAALASILAIIGGVGELAGNLNNMIELFDFVNETVSAFGGTLDLSTIGIAALIAILAVLLLQNEEFRAALEEVLNMLMLVLEPVFSLVKVLTNSLKPVLSFINQVLGVFISIIAKVASAIVKLLVPPFNLLAKVINFVIKGINLLLTGLKFITFGAIDIQIPEIPEIGTDSSSESGTNTSNNNQNNNVTFNNNYQINKELDADHIVNIVNSQLGKSLR